MYWCDYCKVWMQDNPSSKATHERGLKHKENVARSKSSNTASPKFQRPFLQGRFWLSQKHVACRAAADEAES